MNEVTKIEDVNSEIIARIGNGMNAKFAAYMRGGKTPPTGSVPNSTSRYLNSPLFRSAFTTMALRRFGDDVPVTYDVPDMSRGLDDVIDYNRGIELLEAEKEKNPEFAKWVNARKAIIFDIDALGKCEKGTLGEAIHDFVKKSGMEMNFTHKAEIKYDIEYVLKCYGQSHDLQHIISGFGANLAGEHALALMNITASNKHLTPELGQFFNMASSFVTAAGFARTFFNYPGGTEVILEATQSGIEAGRAIKTPLFMIDWDKYLDWKLEDAAADLGFTYGPGKKWDYSEECCAG